jgi:hypothetical protein
MELRLSVPREAAGLTQSHGLHGRMYKQPLIIGQKESGNQLTKRTKNNLTVGIQ